MKGDPLVSIICMVYNHEPYLRQCLNGFVMQKTTFPFEAVVHDDASTDGSAAIIREYAENYPDIIKPLYETENQYLKGTTDAKIRAARHPNAIYTAFCEGDDFWTDPYKLQKQVDALIKHPECTIAFSRVKTIQDGKELDWTIPIKPELIPEGIVTLEDYLNSEFKHGVWTFHTSTFLYRRSCGKLNAQLWKTVYKDFPFGDQPLLFSCLFQGNGYYIPDVTGYYRVLSGGYNSQLRKDPHNQIENFQQRLKAWNAVDEYTNGRYSAYFSINRDRYTYRILKLKYQNGMMNFREKCAFLFYRFWKVRNSFSSLKMSLIEYIYCIYPEFDTVYDKIKKPKRD